MPLSILVLLLLSQPGTVSPFWKGLEPGPHAVGLRTETVARRGGSSIQTLVFYPAVPGQPRWTLKALLLATCGSCAERLLREVGEFRKGATVDAGVLDLPLESHVDAQQKEGRWPLIVFDGGLQSDALSYFALAEFLASHGFVAVSMPSVPYAAGTPLGFDGDGVRSKTNSVTAVLDAAASWRGVDGNRTVLAAWSVGGVSTAAAASRDSRVKGLLSLDGALGYDYGPKLLSELKVTAIDKPILHITGALPNAYPVPKSDEIFSTLGSPSWVATVEGVNHSHFVMQGGVVPYARDTSAEGDRFWRANRQIAELSLAFAEWALHGRDAEAALRTLATRAGAGAAVVRKR